MSYYPFASLSDSPSIWPRKGNVKIFTSQELKQGHFFEVLTSPLARILLGHQEDDCSSRPLPPIDKQNWEESVSRRIEHLCQHPLLEAKILTPDEELLWIGIAALQAFLQSNVTGPPLDWTVADVIFPEELRSTPEHLQALRRRLLANLTVDGEAAYQQTPHVELFCLAKCILNSSTITQKDRRWARLRINFWHQRMLSSNATALQLVIYDDLDHLDRAILGENTRHSKDSRVQYLLERAAINNHHGSDAKAREDIDQAAKESGFEFTLTGRLGKRTKFQEKELSQLVVLAKSSKEGVEKDSLTGDVKINKTSSDKSHKKDTSEFQPQNLDLNDDTLLESIAFVQKHSKSKTNGEESIPPSLSLLDPANQPALRPLDSIILLSLASSITNTSPQHGLTREETLPYANRVLQGGSTNWQIYTQALLVRSRIEGYRSRTVERGVLQLQALVDQVIAETTPSSLSQDSTRADNGLSNNGSTTFLPRPKPSESAPVVERLRYIDQLASPTRWILEGELAARWVSLGGLRTALEIYERLEMWAEAALCWAAVEREDKARKIVRRQLYESTSSNKGVSDNNQADPIDEDGEEYLGRERVPLPADAPRLFCILGDLDASPSFYERAWQVSNNRYARAQRSLGKHFLSNSDLAKADEAYSKSLKINPLNQSTWFTLGCVRLEIQDWKGAVDAFSRSVQIEEEDAESWSNLAAALLRLPADEDIHGANSPISISELKESTASSEAEDSPKLNPQKHIKEAFVALKRAAALKRDSYRIWQNLLNVSATLSPPPYTTIIIGQQRLIELRGPVDGEKCIDIEIMEGLLTHIITSAPYHLSSPNTTTTTTTTTRPHGLETMFTTLLSQHITPLITSSRRLWLLTARLALHQNRPAAALAAYEKAWRVTLNAPGWEASTATTTSSSSSSSSSSVWHSVLDATQDLISAYESLGEREREREPDPKPDQDPDLDPDPDPDPDLERPSKAQAEVLNAAQGQKEDEGRGQGQGQGQGQGEEKLVCKAWRFKARSAVRSVLGRAKEAWGESEGYGRLRERLGEF